MSKNVLYRTKCTVIGPMQFFDGTAIRDYFKEKLSPRNVTVFDHYNNPFLQSIKEDKETVAHIKRLLAEERFDELEEYESIRTFDLALIDKSDFVILDFIPDITMCGTWEEFFWANRMKKPIFFIASHGKGKVPAWVYWTIPPKYVYSSKEQVLEKLIQIDDGLVEMDSSRWKILKPELR